MLAASRPTDAVRQAREILERWNSSDLFERISRTESLDSLNTRFDAVNVKKPEPLKPAITADDLNSVTPKKSRAAAIAATEDRQFDQSALAHVELLDGTTVASSPVTGEGITPELQRVMNLAKTRESQLAGIQPPIAPEIQVEKESVTEIDPPEATCDAEESSPDERSDEYVPTDAPTAQSVEIHHSPNQPSEDRLTDELLLPEVANIDQTSETTQLIQSVPAASVVSNAESEESPQLPAETANASELEPAAVPKKIPRSSMRRPLLHRRFQLDRPATLRSTGPENVNRNLRVDQPGGNDDISAASAARQTGPATSSVAPETKIVSNSSASGRRFRVDTAEPVNKVTNTDGRRSRTQTLPKHRYIDDAHDLAMRGPHFQVTAPRRSNLTSVTGQFLAYLGVLGLTIGTAMVIYGHFGGYSEYTPTGWLVTTVAQMLLFLGVINLVSGGIEQNNDDVSRRINTLGEQLLRIEQVTTDAMRGPKLPAHLYDNPDAEVEENSRETVGVQRD